ncbi:peptide deformylase [Candidatus Omnitrophota bacterium]
MSKLNIKVYPDPILRRKASLIAKVGKEEQKLAYNMIETMRDSDGVGLAGPQVGIGKRIIVMEDVDNKSALVFINPRIVKKKGRSRFCEGCLSMPGITNDVIRPSSVVVEAINLDGDAIKIDAKGLLARILQHEIDHLDGILFIDRINFLKRKQITKKIKASKTCVEF